MVLEAANAVAVEVGTSITEMRVGEKLPALGPAPARIVPASDRFAFHCSFAVYAVAAATGITFFTKPALRLKPAAPPLSFHTSGWPAVVRNAPPLTAMPRSWL